MRNYLVLGSWNCICDRCGFRYKAEALRKEWTGLLVCGSCFETRHPQTLIRVPREEAAIPWARPEAADTFVAPVCDLWSNQARADFGSANCAVVGTTTPIDILIAVFNPTSIAALAITGRSISGVT